jgi:transcription initiation factor TFIID TATA-box-binding protein
MAKPKVKKIANASVGVRKLNVNPVIKVQNIVVSADLHATVDLYALSKNVKEVDYEPEQFPGAIFRVKEPKSVIILFKNGKLICSGCNTEANIKKVLEYTTGIISKYVIEMHEADSTAIASPKEKVVKK